MSRAVKKKVLNRKVGTADGYGWGLMKRCLLMKVFQWQERYTKWKITSARGWAYYAWATEHEATVWGTGLIRSTPAYIAQEITAIRERKKRK